MSSFTENVKLLTDAQETLAAIAKVNEAIKKLRHEAQEPIKVKVQSEHEKTLAGEKKIREERDKNNAQEEKALKKRLEDYKAIKKMNAEQGNPSYEIRYGSQASINQGQKFNEQLAETTKRINQLADAHKHIKQTAKAADVALSPRMAETLASQTVNKVDKAAITDEQERIKAIRLRDAQEQEAFGHLQAMRRADAKDANERRSQEEYGAKWQIDQDNRKRQAAKEEEALAMRRIAFSNKLKENMENLTKQDAGEAGKAQVAMERELLSMEKERIRLVRERQSQEEEGAKRVIAMEREKERIEREHQRAQDRAKREVDTQIASSRASGLRGVVGEVVRDARRAMVYGALARGEQLLSEGYQSAVTRSTVNENLRQAGRTPEEMRQMQAMALRLQAANPTLTNSELMTMQQHNIGATGNFNEGLKLGKETAAYVAMRKDKIGEEAALAENLANLKVGEETGHIKDQAWMHKFLDQQLKIAQSEGGQYDPKSFLQSIRMEKSAKFQMSDEAQLNVLPFLGIMEGAGRAGNEVAMMFKSLSFAGKSISKQNEKEIAGTIMSDGKGGYNPLLQQQAAAGDIVGLAKSMDTFFRQKGFNPDDHSQANRNNEIQSFAKTISNSSAREAILTMTENLQQILKQQAQAAKAEGLGASSGLSGRTLKSAQDAMKSNFDDMNANMIAPFEKRIIGVMNGIARIEQMASQNPGTATGVLAGGTIAAIAGIWAAVKENPGQAALTASNLANTGATATNTAALIANTAGSKLGALSGIGGKLAGGVAAGEVAAGAGAAGGTGALLGIGPIGWAALAGITTILAADAYKNKYNADEIKNNIQKYKDDPVLAKRIVEKGQEHLTTGDFNQGDPLDTRPTKEAIIRQMGFAQQALNQAIEDAAKEALKNSSSNGYNMPKDMADSFKEAWLDRLNDAQKGHSGRGPKGEKPKMHFGKDDVPDIITGEDRHEQYGASPNKYGNPYGPNGRPPMWSNAPAPYDYSKMDNMAGRGLVMPNQNGISFGGSPNNLVERKPEKIESSAGSVIMEAAAKAAGALADSGPAIAGALTGVGDSLSGGGGVIVSALEKIAAEIAGVKMPTTAGGGGGASTGHNPRGPR